MDSTLESKNFDILNAQVAKQIRFEDIPKPTELEPIHIASPLVSKVEDEGVVPEEGYPVRVKILEQKKLSVISAQELEKKTEVSKKFALPKELLEYVHKLVGKGRKLRALAFDMEFVGSNQEIKNILIAECTKGMISEEEKKEMFGFLVGDMIPPAVKNVSLDPLKQEKLEKFKTDYGIVVH